MDKMPWCVDLLIVVLLAHKLRKPPRFHFVNVGVNSDEETYSENGLL